MTNHTLFIVFSSFILFSCKPKNENEKSELQGTKWQNCIFQEPEIQLWTKLFKSYLAKKMVRYYMSCKEETLMLTIQNMVDLYANPQGKFDENLQNKVREIGKEAVTNNSKSKYYNVSGKVLAEANGGTLGSFWVIFDGKVSCSPYLTTEYQCSFEGVGIYTDYWNFDKKNKPRVGDGVTQTDESRVRIAREWMSGKPFKITSEQAQIRFSTSSVPGGRNKIQFSGIKPSIDESETGYTDLGNCLILKLKKSRSDGAVTARKVFDLFKNSLNKKCEY